MSLSEHLTDSGNEEFILRLFAFHGFTHGFWAAEFQETWRLSEIPQQIQSLEARAKPNGKSFSLQTRIQLDESETSSRALVGGD